MINKCENDDEEGDDGEGDGEEFVPFIASCSEYTYDIFLSFVESIETDLLTPEKDKKIKLKNTNLHAIGRFIVQNMFLLSVFTICMQYNNQ